MERVRSSPKRINSQPSSSKKRRPLKVVYISSPMKVTTSAAAFRAVVQELTGQNSHIADIFTHQPSFESSLPPRPAERFNFIPRRHQPPMLVHASDVENPFKFIPERFEGSMEDYLSGILSPSLLFDPPQLGAAADCADGVYGGD